MSTTTRKVQAQRKFAQGAYIPQKGNYNVNNTTAERKTEISPKETNNNFFHNSSAKSLLDIVCFQNVHFHKQPIVLLERLHDIQSVSAPRATDRVTRGRKHKNKFTNEADSQKSKPTAKKHCMVLRSRTNQRPQKRDNIKEMNLAQRKIITRNVRKFLSSLNRSDSSDCNTDDDKPLTHFTRTVEARKIERNIKTTTKRKMPRRNAIDEPVAMSVDKVVGTYEGASLAPKLPDSSLPLDEPVAMSVDKVVRTYKGASLAPKLPDSSLPLDEPVAMSVDKVVGTYEGASLAPKLPDSSLPLDEPVAASDAVSIDEVEVSSEASFGSQALDAPLLWGEPFAMSVDQVVQSSEASFMGPQPVDSPLHRDEPVAVSVAVSIDKVEVSSEASFGLQALDAPLLWGEPFAMSVDQVVQSSEASFMGPQPVDSPLHRDEPVAASDAVSIDEVEVSSEASFGSQALDAPLLWGEPFAMSVDQVVQSSEASFMGPQPVNSLLHRDEPVAASDAVSIDKVEVPSEAFFGSQALDAPLLWGEPVAMSVDQVVQSSEASFMGPQPVDSPLPLDETIAQSVDEPVPSIVTSLRSQRDELPLPRNDPIARSDEPSPVMNPVQSIVISLGSQQEESPLPRANEEVPTVQGGTRVIEIVEDTIDWASTDGEQNIEKTVPAGCSINELNAWIQETIKQKKHVNRFKIPHPPRPKQSSRLQTVAGRQISTNNFDMPSTSTVRAFSCPSKRYTTSREVLQAPKEELDKRCMKCKYCDFVNRVFEIRSERETPSNSDNSVPTQNEGFSSDSTASSGQWNTSYSYKRKTRCRQAFRKRNVNTGSMGGEHMSSELPPSPVIPLPLPRSNNRPQPPQPIKSFYAKDSDNIFEFKLSWLSHKKKFILSADPVPSPSDIVMTELNSPTDTNIKNSVLEHLDNIRKSEINNDDGAIPSTSRGPDPEPVVTMPVKENSNNVGTRNRGGCQAQLNSLRRSVINNDDGAIPSTSRGPDPEPVVIMPVKENSNNVGTRNRGGCQAQLNSLRRSVINNDDGAIPSTSRGPDPEPVVTMPVKENSNTVGTRNRGGCQAQLNSLRRSVINNDDGAIPSTSRGPDPEPVVTMPVKENSNNVGTINRGGCQAEKLKAAFPRHNSKAEQVDAPVFYPTEDQFLDPIAYFNEIMPTAAKFGVCKIVAPETFKPECVFDEEIKFGVTNQYISRLYTRWGPASREMSAIKAHLASQSVLFTRPPLLNGIEVNLPKLYELVQRCGGLKKVIEKKRWSRVAEEMKLTKSPNIEKKLDQIYVKYILPYDTMSNKERLEIMNNVEVNWNKKNKRMLDRALNPLHRQKRLLGESESSGEDDDHDLNITQALTEAEDCIVTGRYMNLATFKKVAARILGTHFSTPHPATHDVESAYWELVLLAKEHVCVNAASIDTGEEGYGFTKNQRDIIGRHPWNLKVLSCNPGNILRYLGSKLGVTVPTLHLGMVFSTSCWHRDPHGLPWIEYMHSGPAKIWYGIPDEQSANFRRAVELLCPTSCQNKSLWLSSDIVMIPPNLLLEHNVSLSRVEQKPGEFIVVFPKAYSCSISTGYTVSESVYFANNSWLKSVHQVFNEVRESCEPTMFSLEQLLLAAARDHRSPLSILPQIYASLRTIISEERDNRAAIIRYNVPSRNCKQSRKRPAGAWNVRDQDECEICRATLYLSRVRGLPTKKSTVCLQHGRRLLESRRQSREAPIEMDVFLSEIELEKILQAIQNRLVF